jgi:hypothetical protein
VIKTRASWAIALLHKYEKESVDLSESQRRELLFSGSDTQLAADQGVRGYMRILNDFLWVANDNNELDLREWDWVRKTKQDDNTAVSEALRQFERRCVKSMRYVSSIAETMADFDWRLPSALDPTDPDYSVQAMYRGSSGYREIRRRMLVFIKEKGPKHISDLASQILGKLGYGSDEAEE